MGPKRAPVGGLVVRQRPLPLRSRVVTTKVQLDINVERLLRNRGRLTAPPATLPCNAHQALKSANSNVYGPRETEIRFW
jgi:hypothetical protein